MQNDLYLSYLLADAYWQTLFSANNDWRENSKVQTKEGWDQRRKEKCFFSFC